MHREITCEEDSFLKDYEAKNSSAYARLAQLVAQFMAWRIYEGFRDAKYPVLHQFQHRAKSRTSLERNIKFRDMDIHDIKDLAGARLIFYFKDDLDKFVNTTQGEFIRWFGNTSKAKNVSGSKHAGGTRQNLPGYQSYHLPVRVTRGTLFYEALRAPDQDLLDGKYCEVQLRTVAKHAWAEAEHELRYKPELVSGVQISQKDRDSLMYSAAAIDIGERILCECKARLEEQHDSAQTAPEKDANVTTPSDTIQECPYKMLDTFESGQNPPKVIERPDIFDINQAMKKSGIENYKQTIWDKLREENSQSLSVITDDSMIVRVSGWDFKSRKLEFQPARYSDYVVTNYEPALEMAIPGIHPDKEVFSLSVDGRGSFLDFCESPMANSLGVACVVRVEGNQWVIAHRSRAVSFEPGSIGCPGSGVLEWTEMGHWDRRDFVSWCAGGISRELEEELGYSASPEDFIYLGFAREKKRAGKPQLFFLLDLCDKDITLAIIRDRWATYAAPDMSGGTTSNTLEFKAVESISTDQARRLVESKPVEINGVTEGVRISDELRMNLRLALEYLENKIGL